MRHYFYTWVPSLKSRMHNSAGFKMMFTHSHKVKISKLVSITMKYTVSGAKDRQNLGMIFEHLPHRDHTEEEQART